MTFRRFAVSLVSVCAFLGCSDQAPIISLNVTAGADVPVVDQIHVKVTQGSRQFVEDFKPPTEKGMGDAGPSIQDSFFERITLPGDFTGDDALVQVEARRAGGAPFSPPLTDETTVRIEEDGVVAAYVTLKFPVLMPPAMGAGGAGGDSGAAGASGAPSVEGGAAGTEAAGAPG